MRAALIFGLTLNLGLVGCVPTERDATSAAGGGAAGMPGNPKPDAALRPTGKIVSLYCPDFESVDGPREGAPYEMQIPAGGGTAPYQFSIASGELPPGLSLSSYGRISGTPSGANTFTLGTVNVWENAVLGAYESTIEIDDAAGSFALCFLQIVVSGDGPAPPTPAPYFDYPQLPTFGAGEPIAFQPAAFGTPYYSFELTGLPVGVVFDIDTGLIWGKLETASEQEIVFRMLVDEQPPIERPRTLRTLDRPSFNAAFDGTYTGTKQIAAPFATHTGKIIFQVQDGMVVTEGVQTGQSPPLRGTIDDHGVFEGEHEGRMARGNPEYEMPAALSGTFSTSRPFVLSGQDATGQVVITLTLEKKD